MIRGVYATLKLFGNLGLKHFQLFQAQFDSREFHPPFKLQMTKRIIFARECKNLVGFQFGILFDPSARKRIEPERFDFLPISHKSIGFFRISFNDMPSQARSLKCLLHALVIGGRSNTFMKWPILRSRLSD